MSADLHSSGNNSFYSNLIRISEFYNLPDFDPIFLTETKIKHYVNLMQQKYIPYWRHTIPYHIPYGMVIPYHTIPYTILATYHT